MAVMCNASKMLKDVMINQFKLAVGPQPLTLFPYLPIYNLSCMQHPMRMPSCMKRATLLHGMIYPPTSDTRHMFITWQ